MALPRHAVVVSHTHWDREWYRTVHDFRVSLVEVVGKVLDALDDDPDFHHFLLDGQAVILEDYLEDRPEDEARIREHIAAGRLSVGPWFVLPDNFLIAPESQVRNLLIGNRVASRYGPVQRAGYMPDSFGHPAQLPQLLASAGIDSFFSWRGNGDELEDLGLEYRWQAPDGSQVTMVQLWGGYCNAAALGFEEIWHTNTPRTVNVDAAAQKVRELLEEMASRSNADVALVMNGCDHHPPQRELGRILERVALSCPATQLEHAGLARYLELLRAESPDLKTFEGELVSGRYAYILTGVWSARMPLKQENERCSRRLATELEPLASYAAFLHGRSWPRGMLDRLWRQLLLNQPHDSICGCSTDEVHRDMWPRYKEVMETSEAWLASTFRHLVPHFAPTEADDYDTALCVMNPLPFVRTEVVERLVVLQPKSPPVDELRMQDARGREVPCDVVEVQPVERFWGMDYRAMIDFASQERAFRDGVVEPGERLRDAVETDLTDRFVRLRFQAADLPGVGHAVFHFTSRPAVQHGAVADPVQAGSNLLENEQVRVELHADGSFDLLDKRTGQMFRRLNQLVDTEDAGDEYDISPAPHGDRHVPAPGTVHDGGSTPLMGVLVAQCELQLPAGLEPDRRRRGEPAVCCPISVRITVQAGSPVVDVRLELDNRASDHRLRALFPVPWRSETLLSDGHFQVNERPLERPSGEDWVQPPVGTVPQQGFSALEGGDGGLAVLNAGLPEAEAIAGDETTLALTLLRCVGWLSRDDFPTRRHQHAGPMLPTPDAQCHGAHALHYAVLSYAGTWHEANVAHWSDRWRTRVLTSQGVEVGAIAGRGLLTVDGAAIRVSAIKRHQERETLIVRLVNLTSTPQTAALKPGATILAAWTVNLLEERDAPVACVADMLEIRLPPHRIQTVELQLDAGFEEATSFQAALRQ